MARRGRREAWMGPRRAPGRIVESQVQVVTARSLEESPSRACARPVPRRASKKGVTASFPERVREGTDTTRGRPRPHQETKASVDTPAGALLVSPAMAVRPIVKYPDPVLLAPTRLVGANTEDIRKLVEDMWETMYDAPGVG